MRLGVGGLALTLTGPAGAYWPFVIGGLYAAGVAALLEPGGPTETVARDPEGMRVLARAIRQDVPESVGAYVRTRWWSRLAAGAQPPERHPECQLGVLHAEAVALAAAPRETESRRQESHTRYLEERGGGPA